MCSDPNKPRPHSAVIDLPKYKDEENASRNGSHETRQLEDPEKRAGDLSEPEFGTLDLNHYRWINQVWHYNSVDFGSSCKLPLLIRYVARKYD
jgi:hypothetical protein